MDRLRHHPPLGTPRLPPHQHPGDTERGARLFAELQHERFWCDNCGRLHPLIEHRDCRANNPFRTAYRG